MHIKAGSITTNRILRDTGENTGGGGTPPPENQQPDENNGENNVDDFTSLWNNPQEGEGDNPPQNQPQESSQQVSAGEAFNQHIESLNLMDGVDINAVASGIQEGNMEPLQQALQSATTNAYKNAILDATRVMDAKVQDAIEQAVTKSNGRYQADAATKELGNALPFTKHPSMQPMAQAVMSQLMKQGKSTDEAIEGVRQFFQHTSKLAAKDLGLNVAPKSKGNKGFGDGGFPSAGDDDAENSTDWISALTGK